MTRAVDQAFDLLFFPDDASLQLGLMLWKDPRQGKRVGESPTSPETLAPIKRPTPVILDSWEHGAGASKQFAGLHVLERGHNVCLRDPRGITPAGEVTNIPLTQIIWNYGPILDMVEYPPNSGTIMLVTNSVDQVTSHILKFTLPGSAITLEAGLNLFPETATIYGGNLYIGGQDVGSGSNRGIAKYTGSAWTTAGSTVVRRKLWTSYTPIPWAKSTSLGGDGQEPNKWRINGTDTTDTGFYFTGGDPMNSASWGALQEVTDPKFPIMNVVAGKSWAAFLCRDGVKWRDTKGEIHELTPQWRHVYGLDNGEAGAIHDGYLYVSHHLGPYRIDLRSIEQRQDDVTHVGVGVGLPNWTDVGTRVCAYAQDNGWIVAAFFNEQAWRSEVWYGRPAERANAAVPGPMDWRGAELVMESRRVVKMLHVTPNGVPYLLISSVGTDNRTPYLDLLALPRSLTPLQDYLQSGPMKFRTSDAWVTFPEQDWQDKTSRKAVTNWEVAGRNLSALRSLNVSASVDDAAYVDVGTATSGPRQSLGVTNTLSGYGIKPKVTIGGERTSPAIFEGLKVTAVVLPESVSVRTYNVVVRRGQENAYRVADPRDPYGVTRRVLSLHDRGPISMRDEHGVLCTVEVQVGDIQTVREDDTQDWVNYVPLSVIVLQRHPVYDEGYTYDSGEEYV